MNFSTILTFINILTMGAVGVGFVYNKTDAVKFDPTPVMERIAKTETSNAVQDSRIETITKDISEIKSDVKSILKAVRQEDYNPAVSQTPPKNSELVRGINPDGSPKQ